MPFTFKSGSDNYLRKDARMRAPSRPMGRPSHTPVRFWSAPRS